MSKKILSLVLIGLVFNWVCYSKALPNFEIQDESVEKIKLEILKLGVGPGARIKVKLRDNRIVKGFVSERNDDYFIVTDEKSKFITRIKFSDVKEVNNFSKNKGLTILVVAALLTGYFIAFTREKKH